MGQAHGLKELSVGDIRMVFSGATAPAAARSRPLALGEPLSIELATHAGGADELDVEAIESDPRYVAYIRHGANPVAG